MNKVEEVLDDQAQQQVTVLQPFLRLETGSLVTLRMQGHSRSPNGQEYYAPAVVLAQYADDYGSIDALVWDSSAGNHYAHGYHVREVGVRGEGGQREMYELQSNVGQILFSPDQFAGAMAQLAEMYIKLNYLGGLVVDLNKRVNALSATDGKADDAKGSKK